MSSTTELFATRNWYVAGWSHDLTQHPLGRMICGRRIALFRDSSGRPQAIDALCPHRGADLSLGTLAGDSLACPFHGFAFAGTGACTRIPSQTPGAPIPKQLRVATYPLVERAGMLWIWADPDSGPDSPPVMPQHLDPPHPWRRQLAQSVYCIGSYLASLENALDDAHLGFIHTKTLPGAPHEIAPYRVEIAVDRRSYRGEAVFDPMSAPRPVKSEHRSGMATGDALLDWLSRFFVDQLVTVRRVFEYQLSGLVCYSVDYVGGKQDHAFAFFTPGEAERTWMFPGYIRNHSLNGIADRVFERFMPALLAEDVGAMSFLLPESSGPGGLAEPFVVRADRTSFPFRRLYGEALQREGKPVPWALDGARAVDRDLVSADVRALA